MSETDPDPARTPVPETHSEAPRPARSSRRRIFVRSLIGVFIGSVLCLILLFLLQPKSRTQPYYATWQAIVDQGTVDKLIAGMQEISISKGKSAGARLGHQGGDSYTESFSGELPGDLKKEQQSSLVAYRGSGDFVRTAFLAGQNEIDPRRTSQSVNWEFDRINAQSRSATNGIGSLLSKLSQLLSFRRSTHQWPLNWGTINYSRSEPGRTLNLTQMVHGTYVESDVSRVAKRISTGGYLMLHFSHGEFRPNPEMNQQFDWHESFEWTEDLRDGDAVVLVIKNPRLGSVAGGTILVLERVDLPVEYADSFPTMNDLRDWITYGPERIRRLIGQSLEWGAKGEKTLRAEEKWSETLSDGRPISLLALGRPNEYPNLWWTPDGKGVDPELLGTLGKENSKSSAACVIRIAPGSGEKSQSENIDLRRDQNMLTTMTNNGPTSRLIMIPQGKTVLDWDQIESFARIHRDDPLNDRHVSDVEIMFGTGGWKKIGEIVKGEFSEFDGRKLQIQNIHSHAFPRQPPRTTAFCNVQNSSNEEVKLSAVRKDGKVFEAEYSRGPFVPQLESTYEMNSFVEQFGGIAEEDIDHFDIYVRPLEKVRFENVNFSPEGLPEPVE